jgi:hypothetical protein
MKTKRGARKVAGTLTGKDASEASGVRTLAAGAVDAAIAAGVVRAVGSRSASLARGVAISAEIVREQVRSPGQRLLGLRTVDRRTGARVAPWRSLLIAGAGVGGQALVGRLAPKSDPVLEGGDYLREADELHRLHADDEQARRQALASFHQQHQVPVARVVLPMVAVGLLNIGLRRRLAPTRQVRAGEDR